MRDILESTLRAFVAAGSGISPRDVVPGMTSDAAPDGLYASVLHISENRKGQQIRFQRVGETASYTQGVNIIEATYSVQFYREGAVEAAQSFSDWAMSETGLNWAATAIVDGRILGANVYAGGSGYLSGEAVTFQAATQPPPSIVATGTITTNGRGEANGILMVNAGAGYYEPPNPVISSANGTGAATAARGYGFVVMFPVQVQNITADFAGDLEERAKIDLTICYERPINDRHSGRVERWVGERESVGGASVTIDSDNARQ